MHRYLNALGALTAFAIILTPVKAKAADTSLGIAAEQMRTLPETAPASLNREPASLNRERVTRVALAQAKQDVGKGAVDRADQALVAKMLWHEIDGRRIHAHVSKAGLNGYTVTETPIGAKLFMRVFEKGDHILAAFNYMPAAIATMDDSVAPSFGPYTVKIGRGDDVLAEMDIAEHHSGQEWVWMNKPLTYLRTPMETGQYPRHEWQKMYDPFAKEPVLIVDDYDMPRLGPEPAPYTPLSAGRNVANWGATGKHNEVHWDIYTSAWILTGDDAYWARVMEAALNQIASPLARTAYGTSNIPDLTTQEYARTFLGHSASAKMPRVPQPKAVDSVNGDRMATDVSHWAAPQWEVYAMSDHPYFLYSAQQFTNYATWATVPSVRHRQRSWKSWRGQPVYADDSVTVPDRLVVDSQQQRALGKGIMAALRMWQLTPENQPDWLLPKSYWAKMITDTAGYIKDMYMQYPLWKLGLMERSYFSLDLDYQADTGFDFMDLQVNWAVFAALYAGFDDYQDIADQITAKTGEVLEALGTGHSSITVYRNPAKNFNLDTWFDYADFIRANPEQFVIKSRGKEIYRDKIIGPNSIGDRFKWSAFRVQGMTAIIWQLAVDNDDDTTANAWAGYWRKYETARLHHNYYGSKNPYWSLGHSSTAIDWHIEGPDPSGSAKIYSEAEMVERGMIAARGQEARAKTPDKQVSVDKASQKRRPAIEQRPEEPSPQIAEAAKQTDNLPKAGKTTLPDPGIVTLPDPGRTSLP